MPKQILVAAVLTIALLWPDSLWGQPETSVSETIDVNVVTIDVLVRDKRSGAAKGLDKSAFQLREDGEKIKLDSVLETDSAGAASASVVYVDDTHVTAASRNAALQALAAHLGETMMNGEERVMVVRFDGLTEVLQDFTSTADTILSALEDLQSRDPNPSQSMLLERDAGRAARDGQLRGNELADSLRTYAQALHADTLRSLGALTELSASLAQEPGRKALYLVADGLAIRPLGQMIDNVQRRSSGLGSSTQGDASEGQQLRTALDSGNSGQGDALGGLSQLQSVTEDLQASGQFDVLAAVANSSGISLYPIRPPVVDAASSGLGSEASDRSRAVTDLREGPLLLASATGGLAFVTGTDVADFLRRSDEESSALYSLTYTPPQHPEGSLHEIDLKVKGKGLDVRHRRSYVTKNPGSQLADRAIGAVTLGWIQNEHGLTAKVESQSQAEDGTWNVTLLLTIPIGELGLIEANGVHMTNCRVALLAVTQEGGVTQPQFMQIPLQIPDDQIEDARRQVFGAKANLRLRAGSHQIAIGLWDEITATGSYIAAPIDVGEG